MKNLMEFKIKNLVEECKRQASLSNGVNWENVSWGNGLTFYKYNWKSRYGKVPLSEYFSDFIKAYIFKVNLRKINKATAILRAFKILEISMSKTNTNYRISDLNSKILDEAMIIAFNQYSLGKVTDIYLNLKIICKFLADNHMAESNILKWTYSLPKSIKDNKSIEEDEDNSSVKLPDPRVITFLGRIFRSQPQDLRDIYTSSIFALLLCAPSRINEIMELHVNCLTVLKDSDNVERPCLRFFSEKGFGFNMKWLPNCMYPVAKEAINRLKDTSKNARAVGYIIGGSEKEFYKRINKINFDTICLEDLSILGFELTNSNLCSENERFLEDIEHQKISCKYFWNYLLRKNTIRHSHNEKAPNKVCDKLIIVSKYQLNSIKKTDIFTIEKIKPHYFIGEFNIRPTRNKPRKNIFNRNKHHGSNHGEIKFNSHQIRHMINTMAQRTVLSELEIALWSGRKNIHHNNNYNHVSHNELADLSRELLDSLRHESFEEYEPPSKNPFQEDIEEKISYLSEIIQSLNQEQQIKIAKKISDLNYYLEEKLMGVIEND